MCFKSTIVKDSDLVIEKPLNFRAILSKNPDSIRENTILVKGFKIYISAKVTQEFFVNQDKTLLICSIKNSEYTYNQWISYVMAYFYRPDHIDELSELDFSISIESPILRNVINNQPIKLKIPEDCYEIIPMDKEVIYRILIDNSQLSTVMYY